MELKSYSRSTRLMLAAFATNSCILKTDNGPQMWRKIETPIYKKLKKAQQYMEEVAIDLISLKMSIFNENIQNNSQTLLETYLSSPELDFKDIIGGISDFLLAGIDTTTYTTSFILYHLAKDENVQNLLYQESCKLLPHPDDPVTSNVLKEAQFAKAVLKETLRLHPISVGIGRILDVDVQFSDYHVPANTVIVSQNQIACRLEEYFVNARKFVPQRWLRSHPMYNQVHPFLVLPFGHGPRSCIARRLAEQNMLILTLKVVRQFKLHWVGADIDVRSLLINKPDGPIALVFEKRK